MSAENPARNTPSSGASFRVRRLAQKWPVLIWLAALAGIFYMYQVRGNYSRVNGMVFANLEDIAPPEDGIILAVHVRDGERVTRGQPLVTLDPELIQREIERLEQELVIERLVRMNRFQSELTNVEDTLNNVLADQARDKALLEVAEKKVESVKQQVDAKRALEPDLRAAEIERDAIQSRISTYDARIAALKQSRDDAKDMIQQLANVDREAEDGEEPKALRVLRERLENKTLTAHSDGTVQKVHKLRGVARIGEPVLSFIPDIDDGEHPAKMVRGFVQQKEEPDKLEVGGTIWISERTKSPVAYATKILSVAPDITAIQDYGTPIQGRFLRGREFLCELPEELSHLLPGTGVHLHRDEPGGFKLWNFGSEPVKAASTR